MKEIYIILAFHAHELLWDLPEKLLSYLDEENPMRDTILDQNYIKKRKEEGRDVYSLGVRLGEVLDAPVCVEYSNELLQQLGQVEPEILAHLVEQYRRGRLYPIYGHAHHTHISLLTTGEVTQEILWNARYLHHLLGVPHPKYKGLFPAEASFSYDKLAGIAGANIDYVIFPHLEPDKVPFDVIGTGDYVYRPFIIKSPHRNLLAFPRNFPISQEIWRPITRMKRDEVKNQGYKLGDYPVFFNEYLTGQLESFPIDLDEGVELYKAVIRQELNQAPPDAVLVYIQDLELMDFGDLAIEIMIKSWQELLVEDRGKYSLNFVTPDYYIDQVLKKEGLNRLPEVKFKEINWAPELRVVLRVDGHYPPAGVVDGDGYSKQDTGLYHRPHSFWENGRYYCGIFDALLELFNINLSCIGHGERFAGTGYDLAREDLDTQAIMYLRLMKRACNWGWRPTEGRQKRPCLDGYLLAGILLRKIDLYPPEMIVSSRELSFDPRLILGLAETLKVFIDCRLDYLRYGMEKYMAEKGADLSAAYRLIGKVNHWRRVALQKTGQMYAASRSRGAAQIPRLKQFISLLQDYSQALFMATEYIQQIWGEAPEAEFLVDQMYEYLYRCYPPLFPSLMDYVDTASGQEIESYFESLEKEETGELQFARVTPD
ncbi:MAG: glycoside hydrolase [Firmicutes bacterium]|nr:glycoside hydrolase [Bacillota bacterium]